MLAALNALTKTPAYIKIASATLLPSAALWADDRGTAENTASTNGVPWAWIALAIITATVIDIVRRGIRYTQKNTKINR